MNSKGMLYWWPGVLGSLCFCCLGIVFFRYPGLQNDELLFAATIFRRTASVYILPVGRGLPLMTLSYLGTLKAWIFGPLIRYAISEATVRLPAVLIGAVTILLTYQLVARMHSRRAAIVTTCVLATDASFFLTTCFDWGPVIFQHLFAVTGLLLMLRFDRTGERQALFLAFFAFGLGLWDKAVFVWPLSGFVAAAVIVYPGKVVRQLTRRHAIVAAVGLVMGASPLIQYNVVHPLETFRSSSHFAFNEIPSKWSMLRTTLSGSALQGYLTLPDSTPGVREPSSRLEILSFRLHSATGSHPAGYQPQAMVLALLLLPFVFFTPARRIVLFLPIAFFVAWFQMAITKGAGGAVHHTILLWPLPAIFLGIVFSQALLPFGKGGMWLLVLITLVISGSNLLSLNEYLYEFIRNGSAGSWSDAIGPLAKGVSDLHPSRVIVYDWGIGIPVEVMNKERLLVQYADLPMLPPSIDEAERKMRMDRLEDRNAVWVGHTDGNEQFPEANAQMLASLKAAGFEQSTLSTVADSHGRPIFQVFRLRKAAPVVQ